MSEHIVELLAPRSWVIVGPPGTGKTTALTRCVAGRDCPLAGFTPEAPGLVLAFNSSVKLEIARRLEELKSEIPVSTIDSYALQILRDEYKLYGSEDAIDELRARIARKFGFKYSLDPFRIAEGNKVFEAFDRAFYSAPARGATSVEDVLGKMGSTLRKLAERYISELLPNKQVDFTLAKFLAWARCRERGAPRYGTVYIDEAQDLNALDWHLIAECAPAEQYLVAGDPAQSVYLWRLAIPQVLTSLYERAKRAGRAVVLKQSYRVPKAIAERAKRYGGVVTRRLGMTDYDWQGTGAEGQIVKIGLKTLRQKLAEWSGVTAILAFRNAHVLQLLPYVALTAWRSGKRLLFLKETPSDFINFIKVVYARAQGGDLPARYLLLRKEIDGFIEYVRQGWPYDFYKVLRGILKVDVRDGEVHVRRKEYLWPPGPGEDAVVLDTIFVAKGLEFDRVVIVDKFNGNLPEGISFYTAVYVAMTRTRSDVYLALIL